MYKRQGIPKVIQGVLPVEHLWLPEGVNIIKVFLVDACKNSGKARIIIPVQDNTPPTPVCDEFTQVTVDPATCWSAVAAKDLDNGSHDNCVDNLHFAAAKMEEDVYKRQALYCLAAISAALALASNSHLKLMALAGVQLSVAFNGIFNPGTVQLASVPVITHITVSLIFNTGAFSSTTFMI